MVSVLLLRVVAPANSGRSYYRISGRRDWLFSVCLIDGYVAGARLELFNAILAADRLFADSLGGDLIRLRAHIAVNSHGVKKRDGARVKQVAEHEHGDKRFI